MDLVDVEDLVVFSVTDKDRQYVKEGWGIGVPPDIPPFEGWRYEL